MSEVAIGITMPAPVEILRSLLAYCEVWLPGCTVDHLNPDVLYVRGVPRGSLQRDGAGVNAEFVGEGGEGTDCSPVDPPAPAPKPSESPGAATPAVLVETPAPARETAGAGEIASERLTPTAQVPVAEGDRPPVPPSDDLPLLKLELRNVNHNRSALVSRMRTQWGWSKGKTIEVLRELEEAMA